MPPESDGSSADDFRWTAFFQRSSDPLFVLNRRRQLLFVNRAWEAVTGLAGQDVRRRVCKRVRDAEPASVEATLSALAPPREALQGRHVQVRRLYPSATRPCWWDVEFLPLRGPHGLVGIIGKVQVIDLAGPPSHAPLPEKLMALRHSLADSRGLSRLQSDVPAIQRVAEQVRLAAMSPVPVLLVGEAGSGKHWLARTIHQEGASRESAFFALDCRHLPAAALAWALFGPQALAHRAGATLYLREPAQLPRELQARLREHFGSVGTTRPRLLAGSGTDPAADVGNGVFLPEWHAVLTTLTINVPPLRERLADWPVLVERLLSRASHGRESPISGMSDDAWALVRAHGWPGNLAELYAVLASACRRAKGERLDVGDFPWYLRSPSPAPERTIPLDAILEQVERRLIQLSLVLAKGNRSKAAELLAIWRPRLGRRIEALGITDQ